jgi:hypothetical protein
MKTKKLLWLVLPLLALAVPELRAASNREFADIYTECGLGSLIAPRNPIVAAVTNVTWDLGTTAISSNISSPDTCKGTKAKLAAYIHNSYDAVAADLSTGGGTHLNALLALSGKNESFVPALRAGLAALAADPGYAKQTKFEKADALYSLLLS